MKTKAFRHGELVLVAIDKLPDGLIETKTNLLIKGNTGNSHSFKGGKIYLKNDGQFIIGYFQAKNTQLFHPEHGEKKSAGVMVAKLPDGLYELRKQSEFINGELKQVID